MSEKFLLKKFKDINLDDEFFDSLKSDYKEFTSWFKGKSKSGECAYIQIVNGSLKGFLYLKEEDGPITDVKPPINCKKAIKIGTFKIDSHGTRLGERFIKKSLDYAINKSIDTVYVTMFNKQKKLMKSFLDLGFRNLSKKTTENGIEEVLVKQFNFITNNTLKDYPLINLNSDTFLLSIWPQYHTRLFPDSKLFNENFDIIKDISHSNSITKIYIGRMSSMKNIKPSDNLLIYRTSDKQGPAAYRSVATTICVVEDIHTMNYFTSFDSLKDYCKNYSIYSDDELTNYFNDTHNTYYVIKMTYNASLSKRIIRKSLIDDIGINGNQYWGVVKLTKKQFRDIISLGNVNEGYLIR